MDGNVGSYRAYFMFFLKHSCSDFLLSFGDAQGNFLAVKVSKCISHHPEPNTSTGKKAYGYTDLLSCMLLDA